MVDAEECIVQEKRDMLLEFIVDLYEIKDDNTDATLERKIKIIEKRLEVLGVTDLNDIR